MNFEEILTHFLPQIEAEMRRLMAPPDGEIDLFYGMMHYHLGWLDDKFAPVRVPAGKRLRPIFTLIACQALGGDTAKALPAAAAVELIHNFSLIHDDIQDRSATRRGRAAVWSLWGDAQGINVGDSLFVLARNALLKLQNHGVPPTTVLQAVQRLDETCLALCRGQYLDMRFEEMLTVDLEAYLAMITGKTALLLACSGYLGALVATDDSDKAETIWQLGQSLGLAFQIQDDWLGIWGDEATTGKPVADDLRWRKKSLPVVFVLSQETAQANRFRQIYGADTLAESDIAELVKILEEVGAKSYTEEQAKIYVEQATAALQMIQVPAQDKAALIEMANFLVDRAY